MFVSRLFIFQAVLIYVCLQSRFDFVNMYITLVLEYYRWPEPANSRNILTTCNGLAGRDPAKMGLPPHVFGEKFVA